MNAKCGNHLMESSYRDGKKIFDFCVWANFFEEKSARTAIPITTDLQEVKEERLYDAACTGEACRKTHTPKAETNLMYDIKKWLEPHLNGIKNHVYPHSYKFF